METATVEDRVPRMRMGDEVVVRFPEADAEKIRQRVRAFMEFKGFNQKEMAESIGINPTTFREIMRENGNRRFEHVVLGIAVRYNVPTDYLLLGRTFALPTDFQDFLFENPHAGRERTGRGRTSGTK